MPLAKEVRDYLQEYLSNRQDASPALFVGQRGRMTPDGIRDVVAKFAGVPPHRLHALAYEYLRSNNNDLVALAEILSTPPASIRGAVGSSVAVRMKPDRSRRANAARLFLGRIPNQ